MEKEKILSETVGKAVMDRAYLYNLMGDPYGTIKETYPGISRKEAEEIRKKVMNIIPGMSEEEVLNLVKGTIASAQRAFRTSLWMNVTFFSLGIALIILAAVSGVIRGEGTHAVIFGGLGIADVLLFFIFRPMKGVQDSIGNLVQIEIIFLSYYDQLTYWNIFADKQHNIDFATMEKINASIDKLTTKALKDIQNFVEEKQENR